MTALVPIRQSFFTGELIKQRRASPRTVTAYRDALRLLIQFAGHVTGTEPGSWTWTSSTPGRHGGTAPGGADSIAQLGTLQRPRLRN